MTRNSEDREVAVGDRGVQRGGRAGRETHWLPLLLGVALLVQGCASQPSAQPPSELPIDAQSIGVRVVDAGGSIDLEGVTRGRGEGMARGAGGATAGWLDACGSSAGSDPWAPLLCIAVTPVATAVGGIYGLAAAEGAEAVDGHVTRVQTQLAAFDAEDLAEVLRQELRRLEGVRVVVEEGQPADALQARNDRPTDGAVESRRVGTRVAETRVSETQVSEAQVSEAQVPEFWVELSNVELAGVATGVRSITTFHLGADVRLRRTVDGRFVRRRVQRNATLAEPLAVWAAGDPPVLARHLADLQAEFAEEVVRALFLETDVELVLESPEPRRGLRAARIGSLQPEFVWSLRDPSRAAVLPAGVRYDFTLATDDGVVAHVKDLEVARYVHEVPLEPCARYRWSVTAAWQRYGREARREVPPWAGDFRTVCEP